MNKTVQFKIVYFCVSEFATKTLCITIVFGSLCHYEKYTCMSLCAPTRSDTVCVQNKHILQVCVCIHRC